MTKVKNRPLKAIAPVNLAGDGARAEERGAGAPYLQLNSNTVCKPPSPCYFCEGLASGSTLHASGITLPICEGCASLFGFEIIPGGENGNN